MYQEEIEDADAFSGWDEVTVGSALGPMLFLISVNDLPKQLKSYLGMSAYDVKLMRGQIICDCDNYQKEKIGQAAAVVRCMANEIQPKQMQNNEDETQRNSHHTGS